MTVLFDISRRRWIAQSDQVIALFPMMTKGFVTWFPTSEKDSAVSTWVSII